MPSMRIDEHKEPQTEEERTQQEQALETFQQVIQGLARHEISEQEARLKLEAYWEFAHREHFLKRLFREFLPSLSRATETR
jgi:hypothetical protein